MALIRENSFNIHPVGNHLVFKEEENAEGMLVLRGLVLSRRWKSEFAKISESMACDRRTEWQWQSPNMPAQLKANIVIEPPKPQLPTTSLPCDAAA